MRTFWAMVRAGWQSAVTYRMALIFSILGLFTTVIPLYLVANALQPTMAKVISAESPSFFAFTFVGMMVIALLPSTVQVLPGAVQGGITSGTLEILLTTPNRLPVLLAGMIGYDLLWALLRSMIFLAVGIGLGVRIHPAGFLPGLIVLGLILLGYAAMGIGAAALVIAFRTAGPVASVALTGSALLGGVYYPVTVIPEGLQFITQIIPLTYGARALRMLWLSGSSVSEVMGDVTHLIMLDVWFMSIALLVFTLAVRDARHRGTLGQY